MVLPTYNERGSLERLYPMLTRALQPYSAELIIADDRSPDGTAQFARELCGPIPVVVVERPEKQGLASAVLAGFGRAKGDVLVVMDADGSHPPEAVPSLVDAIAQGGAEFALASRWVRGASAPGLSWRRRILSAGAAILARPLTAVRDPMSGFFALNRTVLGRHPVNPIGYKIGLEILVNCRPHPIWEVPYTFGHRFAGESKLGRAEIGGYLRHLARLYAGRISSR